jgi:hypothetical protein
MSLSLRGSGFSGLGLIPAGAEVTARTSYYGG